ncbi:hypothetical protein FKW77_004681 [Venturia effusa]|uniref:Transglycosylase SLT domain-containing protein n=1 Tax=Venturia effusa TaxID=50376 RepID=A0A517L356_9PEZI|nr:hypothetical protein FKW77_004681 [Venturia effusa]
MKFTFSFDAIVSMAIALRIGVSAAPILHTRNTIVSPVSLNETMPQDPTAAVCPPPAIEKFDVEPGFSTDFDRQVPESSWISPDCIWENHKLKTGLGDLTAVSELKKPVYRAGVDLGINPALIMSIIFQESHGILNIHRTVAPDGSSSNGIMQSDGCPSMEGRDLASITEEDVYAMVRCGTQHFKGNMDDAVKNPTHNPWIALRLYNSGSVAPSGNLNDGNGATGHYVNEVANRLRGWSN